MNVLLINPPEYTLAGLHLTNTYAVELYNWATLYKQDGHDVDVFDMYPEAQHSGLRGNIGGDIYYDGIRIVTDTGVVRKCGNFENEKKIKGILRTGLPYSMLEEKLNSKKYDKIVICATGTKTSITGTSWIYVFMPVYECIGICKKIQQESEIILMGEYTKLCPEVAKASGADLVVSKPSAPRQFIETDISLFYGKMPRRINITTSYGCPNECGFCYVSKTEKTDRTENSVDNVTYNIDRLIGEGCTKFRFLDSDMLRNWDSHLKPILQYIIDRGINVDLSSSGGVEPKYLTEEIAETMVAAGFKMIRVPLDNCDHSILDKWGSKKNVNDWDRAAKIACKHFDEVKSCQMIGFPGQTYKNSMESIRRCDDYDIEPDLSPFSPIPGTIYEDRTRNPEELHPLLFPYASPEFTVEQIENILEERRPWYIKSSITPNDIIQTKKIYVSSPAIPIPTN